MRAARRGARHLCPRLTEELGTTDAIADARHCRRLALARPIHNVVAEEVTNDRLC